MGEVSQRHRRRAIQILLKGSARAYIEKHGRNLSTYDEAIEMLRRRYNFSEKEGRLLKEWKQMKLSKEMVENP